jgi:hypothetical protein
VPNEKAKPGIFTQIDEHKHSSKYAKFYAKKVVKYLSKCRFYKKYGNTVDSTENTVESSVFQLRNFHIKDHSNNFTSMAYKILFARKIDFWDKIKEVKFSQLFPCVIFEVCKIS